MSVGIDNRLIPKPDKYFMARFLSFLIRIYQFVFSPLFPPCCRFYPTCSHYAIEAFETYGASRGSFLTLRRIAKCHPFHPGGVDLVPGTEQRHQLESEEECA